MQIAETDLETNLELKINTFNVLYFKNLFKNCAKISRIYLAASALLTKEKPIKHILSILFEKVKCLIFDFKCLY